MVRATNQVKEDTTTLAQEEVKVNRVVWISRALVTGLTGGAVAFFLLTQASQTWQYVIDPMVASLPLAYGILSSRFIRLMHVSLLRRYQAQLVMRSVELQEMAARDELTQLYNRRYFYGHLQEELEKARAGRLPLALILLDVDGLKSINDDYGHLVGDAVIANLAKVISTVTRTGDIPARLGGDEFGIIMPDTDKRGAFGLARRLWAELERTPMYESNGTRINVTVSIGVSGFPWGGEDVDEVMHWADADMYANKVSRKLPAQAATGGSVPSDLDQVPEFE